MLPLPYSRLNFGCSLWNRSVLGWSAERYEHRVISREITVIVSYTPFHYRDRFFTGPFLAGPFLPGPFYLHAEKCDFHLP